MKLVKSDVKYIIWHTAAHGVKDKDYDTTVAEIDKWHKERGWSGIGYHYVIRKSGEVCKGRNEDLVGAQVAGLNSKSIGICFSGHGDITDHTDEQRKSGIKLTKELMDKYNIPVENVLGHREINKLVEKKILAEAYKTTKSCPGNKINMDDVRVQLKD